jgi:hypothetical protein
MKVENMLKLKEEFDYKSLSRRLDIQLEKLIAEHEKQQKAFENEIERVTTEAKHQILESERNYAVKLEVSVSLIMKYCFVWAEREREGGRGMFVYHFQLKFVPWFLL